MSKPNEAMMKMVDEVSSRIYAAGLSIAGKIEHHPESENAGEHFRVTIDHQMLPGARTTVTFMPASELSPKPECAVSYYGPRGNFLCMPFTSNIDAVLIQYGRSLQEYSNDVILGLKNEG